MPDLAGTARFVSDLHLKAERPDLLRRFATFLADTAAANVESLFILGDLFEYWIGDDDLAVVAFENLSGGMGTAAFVAFLMSLCNQRYTATQFALLSAFASVGRVWVGPLAGVLAESIGWPSFFIVSTVLALPALGMLWWLRASVQALDVDPATLGRSDD